MKVSQKQKLHRQTDLIGRKYSEKENITDSRNIQEIGSSNQ